jgi:hypothetical protein
MANIYEGAPVTRRDRLEKVRGALKTRRASFDGQWRDVADFIAPRRIRMHATDVNRGDRRDQKIIDSTGKMAERTLKSGLHAGLTSPARPWMKLTTPDPDLAQSPAVKEWLHVVTSRMLTVFAQTNLYNVLPILYGDFGTFGTAAMAVLEDERDLFRCYPYPIGSYCLAVNKRGLIDTWVYEFRLTVDQLVREYAVVEGTRRIDWSRISTHAKSLWDRGDYYELIDVCWVVMPNELHDANRIESKYLPFTSCHFEVGENRDGRFLRESGFRTFPVLAPRWDVTALTDTYGVDCCGMTALGDVRQLQTMERRKGQAIAKMVDPPLVGPSSLRTQKTSLLPGDITYQDVREGMQGLRAIHEVGVNLSHLTTDMAEVRYRIQRAYYEDLFLMLATMDQNPARGADAPTAREIQERHEEKLLALGPTLERTNDELLDPLVDRVYEMMERNGLIPEAPPELDNVKLKVEYISILAQAQKLVGVVGQDRLVQTVLGMAELMPEAVDKIDLDRLIDNYGDMLGVDPRVVRSNEEANARRQQRAQQQQAALDADNAQKLAQAGKAASETSLDGDSALTRALTGAVA